MKYFSSLRFLVIACCVALMCSCATTEDPREGGLFGYNPEAYEKRKAEREAKLKELEAEKAAAKQTTDDLENEKARKTQQNVELEEKSKRLDQEIGKLDDLIANMRVRTEDQRKRLWGINVKLDAVKKELAEVKAASTMSSELKEKEIERLQQKLDQLLAEAEELSKL